MQTELSQQKNKHAPRNSRTQRCDQDLPRVVLGQLQIPHPADQRSDSATTSSAGAAETGATASAAPTTAYQLNNQITVCMINTPRTQHTTTNKHTHLA